MVYIFVFLTTAILVGSVAQTNSRIAIVVTPLILATFAALRGADVAADFVAYQDWYFDRGVDNGFMNRPWFFEAIYFWVSDFFAMFYIPFRVFVWCMAFIAVFFKIKIIVSFSKSGWSVGVSVLIYALTFYLLHEFTQIRVGLAIAFIFFAVRALVDGNRLRFILLVIIAAGFHSSAIIAFSLLLPYMHPRTYWVDFWLFAISGLVFVLAMLGVVVGAEIADIFSKFDPRLAFYISSADKGMSAAANPFSISALLLLALAISLIGIGYNKQKVSNLDDCDAHAVVLIRRNILIGFIFLGSIASIPEIAMRLFEISISLVPILAAVVFSRRDLIVQKILLIFWSCALAFIYIVRDEGLVQPYVLFFS